jgi:hypothetical protein
MNIENSSRFQEFASDIEEAQVDIGRYERFADQRFDALCKRMNIDVDGQFAIQLYEYIFND